MRKETIWSVFKILCLSFATFPSIVFSYIWDVQIFLGVMFKKQTPPPNFSDVDHVNDSNILHADILIPPKQLSFMPVLYVVAAYIVIDVISYSIIKLFLRRYSKFQCKRFMYDSVHFGTPLILVWAGRKLIMPQTEFSIGVILFSMLFLVITSGVFYTFYADYRKVISLYKLHNCISNNRVCVPNGIIETTSKTYQMDIFVAKVLYGFVGVIYLLDVSGTIWWYQEGGEQFEKVFRLNLFFPFALNIPMVFLLLMDILTSRHLPRTVLYIIQDRQRYVIVREYYCADLQICKLQPPRVVDFPVLPPHVPNTQFIVNDYDQLPVSVRRQIRVHSSTTAA